DDASSVEVKERLRTFAVWRRVVSKTAYLRNEKQQLFTRTVNRGIRYTVQHWNPDAVVVLNTDCTLSKGWLEHLLGAFDDPKVGMAGYRDDQELRKPPYTEVKIPDYVTGHCMLLRIAALREVGILSETDVDGRQDPTLKNFHGQAHIGSERLLCNKMNIYGWKTLYCNGLYVQHADGKSWGRDLKWLSQFILEPLWKPNDGLEPEEFYDRE
ncbi:MAG TPA: glycosyltransferase, partial [Methylomirabilota bacterium]|nr:glycosyltransferase [Methylomirabilota bacterium]